MRRSRFRAGIGSEDAATTYAKVNDMKPSDSEVRQLLPWHVNRTLSKSDQNAVDAALEDSAALAAERDWLAALRQSLQQQTPQRPPDAGLDQLMARIARERDGSVLPIRSTSAQTRSPWRTRGFAIAATVILAQTALLGALLLERNSPDNLMPLGGPTAATVGGVVFQVTFHEQASEAAIRSTLALVHGEIVGGPGALGIYLVRVAAPGTQALDTLRARQDVVNSVNLEGGQ